MNYDHNNDHIDDYYAFLNVPKNVKFVKLPFFCFNFVCPFFLFLLQASVDDIRNSFRLLSRQFHPDKHTNPALKRQAELMFDKLKKAYDGMIHYFYSKYNYSFNFFSDFSVKRSR